MSLEATETECAANAVAPRVSLQSMKDNIAGEFFFTASDALNALQMPALPPTEVLSICILVMKNGFSVIGKSAPASPENFNAELGRKLAYEDAIRQVWPLEGYALRSKLAGA